jgi:hypothetical protein
MARREWAWQGESGRGRAGVGVAGREWAWQGESGRVQEKRWRQLAEFPLLHLLVSFFTHTLKFELKLLHMKSADTYIDNCAQKFNILFQILHTGVQSSFLLLVQLL